MSHPVFDLIFNAFLLAIVILFVLTVIPVALFALWQFHGDRLGRFIKKLTDRP